MLTEEQRVRLLQWEGCLNARDLGGYPTIHGRTTRWGAVYRSDNVGDLTPAGQEALRVSGVRTIVDLRLPEELAASPNPFAEPGDHGISYIHVSYVDPAAEPSPDHWTLARRYSRGLDHFQPAVAEILRSIARAPEGGVLIHCMAGKDRTGIISALLLELAGVPRQIIGEDYALTAECLRPRDLEWLENGPGDRADRERELERFLPRVEVMLEVLEGLDQRHGGPEPYLLSAGVIPDEIERLRLRLLGPA